jgi:hypothetical protein
MVTSLVLRKGRREMGVQVPIPTLEKSLVSGLSIKIEMITPAYLLQGKEGDPGPVVLGN